MYCSAVHVVELRVGMRVYVERAVKKVVESAVEKVVERVGTLVLSDMPVPSLSSH